MKHIRKGLEDQAVNLLSGAIHTLDLNKARDNKVGKFQDSVGTITPGTRVPNVANIAIQLGQVDQLYKRLFDVNLKDKPVLIIQPHKNKRINRFVEHGILRLERHLGKRSYGDIAMLLMKRSNSFRVLAINHVLEQGSRKYPFHSVLNGNRQVSRFINKGRSDAKFKRVYIPKDEKKFRPLGVPTHAGRIYLHMGSNFLTYYFTNVLECQHGFLPSRGTLTAGKTIFLEQLGKKPYIHEGDFTNYFNSIHANRITEELLRHGVPKFAAYFLENINRNNPIFEHSEEEDLVDETAHRMQEASQHFMRTGEENLNLPIYDVLRELMGLDVKNNSRERMTDGYQTALLLRTEDGCETGLEWIQLQGALLDQYRPAKIISDFNGCAQGMPTSPILGNLIMDIGIKLNKSKGHEIIAYADDSITFSDTEIDLRAPADTGIKINEEKSGYIKYDGKFIKPIKFLGLEFDGKSFKAHTRKGSRLELSKKYEDILTASLHRKDIDELSVNEALEHLSKLRLEDKYLGDKGQGYFKSKLIGFIQSRLYSGRGELDELEQDFEMTFINSSGVSKVFAMEPEYFKNLTIFNVSSYSSEMLMNALRGNQKLRKPRSPTFFLNLVSKAQLKAKTPANEIVQRNVVEIHADIKNRMMFQYELYKRLHQVEYQLDRIQRLLTLAQAYNVMPKGLQEIILK